MKRVAAAGSPFHPGSNARIRDPIRDACELALTSQSCESKAATPVRRISEERRRDSLNETVVNGRAPAAGSSCQQIDPALIEWARHISLDQIPGLLLVLASRWLAETTAKANEEKEHGKAASVENLLTAGDLAQRLNVPESWVRTEQRAGRIPSTRIGRYVRFRSGDVDRALAERERQGRP